MKKKNEGKMSINGGKKVILISAVIFCLMQFGIISTCISQCQPFIYIDGNPTSVTGLELPVWLEAGQSLDMNAAVTSISLIEFTVDAVTNELKFSRVRSVTSSLTVPADKVWKIESIIKLPLNGTVLNSVTYSGAGSYTFTVPTCTNYICIETWGGGGGGGGVSVTSGSGGGGGGGAYGSGCFTVTPGSGLSVTVGAGGAGGSIGNNGISGSASSVGSVPLISAGGGAYGVGVTTASSGAGGNGGTCSAYVNIPGYDGGNGIIGNCGTGGKGGAGGNGGVGGNGGSCANGSAGTAPGGGGGGGNSGTRTGGAGASGQVKISW